MSLLEVSSKDQEGLLGLACALGPPLNQSVENEESDWWIWEMFPSAWVECAGTYRLHTSLTQRGVLPKKEDKGRGARMPDG